MLMNRFYRAATSVLVRNEAFIDKFVGDEVMAVYLPVFCGPNHALAAVRSAATLLDVTARELASELQLGVGVNTGTSYFGTVKGVDGTFADFTALGDPVNVCARLAGAAGPGEALISDASVKAAGIELRGCEAKEFVLKGKREPLVAWVLRESAGESSLRLGS